MDVPYLSVGYWAKIWSLSKFSPRNK